MRITSPVLSITAGFVVTVMRLTVAAGQVPAPEPQARFADPGETILTSELALDYQHDTVHADGEADQSSSTYDLHAGFDRVLKYRLTVGARIGFSGTVADLNTFKRFDMGARFGGLFPLTDGMAVWPSLGVVYSLNSYADRSQAETVRTVTMVLSVPLVWHTSRHLLVGAGPVYAKDLQSRSGPDANDVGPKVSSIGVHGFLGFWF